jgi:hypothetical protein
VIAANGGIGRAMPGVSFIAIAPNTISEPFSPAIRLGGNSCLE